MRFQFRLEGWKRSWRRHFSW